MSGSEGLHNDGVQQGHVFSASDWQLVCSVVVDDFRDRGEGGAVLPKHIAAISSPGELHMHEAFAASERERDKDTGEMSFV